MVETPGTRPRLRLKVAMLATLTSPVTITRVVARSACGGLSSAVAASAAAADS